VWLPVAAEEAEKSCGAHTAPSLRIGAVPNWLICARRSPRALTNLLLASRPNDHVGPYVLAARTDLRVRMIVICQ